MIEDRQAEKRFLSKIFVWLAVAITLVAAALFHLYDLLPLVVRLYALLLMLPVVLVFGWYWMGSPIRDFEKRNLQK